MQHEIMQQFKDGILFISGINLCNFLSRITHFSSAVIVKLWYHSNFAFASHSVESLNTELPIHSINVYGSLWFIDIHILSYLLQFWLNTLHSGRDYSFHLCQTNSSLNEWLVVYINDSSLTTSVALSEAIFML